MNTTNNYTYFFTSNSQTCFTISKLHFCSWFYGPSDANCVEIGLQMKFINTQIKKLQNSNGGSKPQKITLKFWAPWLSLDFGEKVEDLSDRISVMANAQFIFNDACTNVGVIDNWDVNGCRRLIFSNRQPLVVFPLNFKPGNGFLELELLLPSSYNTQEEAYIRFCIRVGRSGYELFEKKYTTSILVYNINYGQLRNKPNDLLVKELCRVKDVFCLHIIPWDYQQVCRDNNFISMRILEVEKYSAYVGESKIFNKMIKKKNMIVIFNKYTNRNPQTFYCSFYSVYQCESIGRKNVIYTCLISIFSSILFLILTELISQLAGKVICIIVILVIIKFI